MPILGVVWLVAPGNFSASVIKPEVLDIYCTLRLNIKNTHETINLSDSQVSFHFALTRFATCE